MANRKRKQERENEDPTTSSNTVGISIKDQIREAMAGNMTPSPASESEHTGRKTSGTPCQHRRSSSPKTPDQYISSEVPPHTGETEHKMKVSLEPGDTDEFCEDAPSKKSSPDAAITPPFPYNEVGCHGEDYDAGVSAPYAPFLTGMSPMVAVAMSASEEDLTRALRGESLGGTFEEEGESAGGER